jgi:hypothetical protein
MSRLLHRAAGQAQEIPQAMIAQAAKEPEKRLNVKLPESKHERFRLACMGQRTTMTEAVEAFIDQYLAEHG